MGVTWGELRGDRDPERQEFQTITITIPGPLTDDQAERLGLMLSTTINELNNTLGRDAITLTTGDS